MLLHKSTVVVGSDSRTLSGINHSGFTPRSWGHNIKIYVTTLWFCIPKVHIIYGLFVRRLTGEAAIVGINFKITYIICTEKWLSKLKSFQEAKLNIPVCSDFFCPFSPTNKIDCFLDCVIFHGNY